MVCTRDRPREFDACLTSLARLILPPGVGLTVCVSDNNPSSIREHVELLARRLRLDLRYAHEVERGYASVRNKAIDLVLTTEADAAICIDDDSAARPDLILEHLAAMQRYSADVIVGRIEGISMRSTEGERISKAGTGNVCLRRWIIDPVGGAGLRFDERLNLIGYEDFEFFREVNDLGGVIVRSTRPLTVTLLPPLTVCKARAVDPAQMIGMIAFATMMGRNDVVATRLRHGMTPALLRILTRYSIMLVQGAAAVAMGSAIALVDPVRGRARRQHGRMRLARVRGAFRGLFRPGFDRPRAKEGELVEVAGTGLSWGRRRQKTSQDKDARVLATIR